jgi:hypothetical protein
MMKNKLKTISFVFGTIFFIIVIAYFRAYIDRLPFWIAFDNVLKSLAGGIWILLQNPIVLTSIILGATLWILRERLPNMLALITEIRAGDFSAKIDTSKLFYDEINKQSDKIDKLEGSVEAEKHLEFIVQVISVNLCEYLLKVHNKSISVTRHAEMLAKKAIGLDKIETNKIDFAYGYSFASISIFLDVLFDVFDDDKNKRNMKIVLKPQVLDLIRKRLEK